MQKKERVRLVGRRGRKGTMTQLGRRGQATMKLKTDAEQRDIDQTET